MNSSRFVIAVGRVKCSKIEKTRVLKGGYISVRFADGADWEFIPLATMASLVVQQKEEGKNAVYTATLKFKALADVPVTQNYAWFATLTDGKVVVLGTEGRPYTKNEKVQTSPDKVTENQHTEVTVVFKTSRELPFLAAGEQAGLFI